LFLYICSAIIDAERRATDSPSCDKDQQKQDKGDANKDSQALFRAKPPTIAFLNLFHSMGILLEFLC